MMMMLLLLMDDDDDGLFVFAKSVLLYNKT